MFLINTVSVFSSDCFSNVFCQTSISLTTITKYFQEFVWHSRQYLMNFLWKLTNCSHKFENLFCQAKAFFTSSLILCSLFLFHHFFIGRNKQVKSIFLGGKQFVWSFAKTNPDDCPPVEEGANKGGRYRFFWLYFIGVDKKFSAGCTMQGMQFILIHFTTTILSLCNNNIFSEKNCNLFGILFPTKIYS